MDVHTYEHNTRVRHCLTKLGFVLEGISRQAAWLDGWFVDEANFGLLAGDRSDSSGP